MGLDVYLYRYSDFDKFTALEEEREHGHESIPYEDGKYDEYKARRDEWDREHGFEPGSDDNLKGHTRERIELDSKVHPAHLFKIGYLRSSYNGGGIKHVVRNLIGWD